MTDYCFVCDGDDPARFTRRPEHHGCPRHPVGLGTVYMGSGMARMRGEVGEAFARAPNERAVELLEHLVKRSPPYYARKGWETLGDTYLRLDDDGLRLRAFAAMTQLAAKTGDPALVDAHHARARAIAAAVGDTVIARAT